VGEDIAHWLGALTDLEGMSDPEASALPPAPPHRCCVCLDDCGDRIHPPGTNGCDAWCCDECMATYVKTSVEGNVLTGEGLKCPNFDCGAILPSAKINGLRGLSKDTIQKYEERVAEKATLQSSRDARLRRLLPTFGDLAADLQFSHWQNGRDVKRCPGCRTVIEKNGGCPHMTCVKCSHEFYWCCCRDYKAGHKGSLCALSFIYYQRSAWWGPITPVRAVTKTTAYAVGFAAASVAIPLLVAYKKTREWHQEGPIKRYLRVREARRRAARLQALQAQRREQQQWLESRELQAIHSVLAAWWGVPKAEVFTVYDRKIVESLHRFRKFHDAGVPCQLCAARQLDHPAPPTDSNRIFQRPVDMFLHLQAAHVKDWAVPDDRRLLHDTIVGLSNAMRGDMFLIRAFAPPRPAQGAGGAREVDEGSLGQAEALALEEEKQSDREDEPGSHETPLPTFPISYSTSPIIQRFRERHAREITEWGTTGPAQRCNCGALFNNVFDLAEHALAACRASDQDPALHTGRCLVATSAGRLCSCTSCSQEQGDSFLCPGCSHPRILHDVGRDTE